MPTNLRPVNLLLPEGLSPERNHALAASLVRALTGSSQTPTATRSGGQQKSLRSYLVLSELDGAPPEDRAVLNDSTWTLTVPVPAGTDLKRIAATAKALVDGDKVEVEFPPDYKAS